jgi:hypothetical protein
MQFCGYGLAHPAQLQLIVQAVCDCLGHGSRGMAVTMLMETAAQETRLGMYGDPTPDGAGRGVFQVDEIAFLDVQARARLSDVNVIARTFGVDIRRVSHEQLDFSPLLSAIFARLFYKLIPEPFPLDLAGRAAYWKKYYNTISGRGTIQEFINHAQMLTRL